MNRQLLSVAQFAVCACSLVTLAIGCSVAEGQRTSPSAAALQRSTPAVKVKLSENGRALLPIVVAADASPRVRELATTLAEYLKRISGGEFKVETAGAPFAPDAKGIAVGVQSQFPALKNEFGIDDPTRHEDYILRSHADGVLLVGATELAVQHAVWDFLHRLGYRQYFPGAKWEVVPSEKNLSIAINTFQHPDYYARQIWPGFGALPENQPKDDAWNARNRMALGIELKTGHAYNGIIARNKAEFEQHPEYLTRPLGSTGGNKFCVSNPDLRALVIKDALAQFEKNPNLHSISMDPSDLGQWDSDACNDAQVYKSITDRAVTLANAVAEAVDKKYPGKLIGMYAYNDHSPPPTIEVHPNVVVSIATRFIRGGYTMDELIDGWSKKAKVLGIREYYSFTGWDRDMPGQALGGDLQYLQTSIPHFYQRGARFMSAEASDNWGPNGLGYYIASRLLWDVNEAAHIEEIKTVFFRNMFGTAAEPMREYYRLMDGSGHRPLLSSDLIGRMYRRLSEAFQKTDDPEVLARLNDLALYTRYTELYQEYSRASGAARQKAFEALMRYVWRIRGTQMIHALALYRDLPVRDKQVKLPEDAGYFVAAPKNPWKSSEPFGAEEVRGFVTQGVANNAITDFEPVEFSRDLVPATALHLSSRKAGSYEYSRSNLNLYTWVNKAPAVITLQAQAGLIYDNLGDARFSLYPSAQTMGEAVAEQAVTPNKETREVKLSTDFEGLHRIVLNDGGAATKLSWPEGMPMTIESSLNSAAYFAGGRWSMYFYVPKGTKIVGGYRDRNGNGDVLDGDGKLVKKLEAEGAPGYWSVPVPPGQDGKLWMLDRIPGQIMLMTVPPFLARSADELLLPREVVAADSRQ
jgi:hypothetical protein